MDDPIKITGLREFQRQLKDIDGESQKALRRVNNDAADVVVAGARRLVPVGPNRRARGSIRAQSSQREARVTGGGARAPYYPWLDFGGAVGRGRSIRRPFLKDGRYIYATYSARRRWILVRLEEGLTELAKGAGLAVE